MMYAHGAGAESRVSLGTAVVFGMTVNAILGTLFVPAFWSALQAFKEKHLDNLFIDSSDTSAKDVANSEVPPLGEDTSI
jgi:hypothetical protein